MAIRLEEARATCAIVPVKMVLQTIIPGDWRHPVESSDQQTSVCESSVVEVLISIASVVTQAISRGDGVLDVLLLFTLLG